MADKPEVYARRDAFIKESNVPLYHGPVVKIKVISSTGETRADFEVSKDLLCAQSPVFTAMLNGEFNQAREQIIELEKMDGVVSANAVSSLVEWLYLTVLKFEGDRMTQAIELARFADLYQIIALESKLEQIIRRTISSIYRCRGCLRTDLNTIYLKSEHIISALSLPRANPIRRLLAQASVEEFLKKDDYKFADLTVQYPDYASDLLREVQRAVRSLHGNATYEDPVCKHRVHPLHDDGQ